MIERTIKVLDHGYVTLRNISGPTRRLDSEFDGDDIDPANSARFSFDGADQEGRARKADLKLTRYLMANHHSTPVEMVQVWLEMKLPLFIARQFCRHRQVSINEVSARYSQLPNEFYIPHPAKVGVQSKSNKQARDVGSHLSVQEDSNATEFSFDLQMHCDRSYALYEKSLGSGVPRELARLALPVNIFTKWLWKQDLHNMMHFLRLRLHSHAQYEARCYAQAIYDLLLQVLPFSMQLFDEYRRIAEK